MKEEIREEIRRGAKAWKSLPSWLRDPYGIQKEVKGQAPNNFIVVPLSLKLTREEHKAFMELRKEMDLSGEALAKQGLRVLQMYRAGYLVDNSPKMGGCGACG